MKTKLTISFALLLTLLLTVCVHAGERGTDNANYKAAAAFLKDGKFEDAWPKLVEALKEEPESVAILAATAYCAEKMDKAEDVNKINQRIVDVGEKLEDKTPAEEKRIADAKAFLAKQGDSQEGDAAAGEEQAEAKEAEVKEVRLKSDDLDDPEYALTRGNLRNPGHFGASPMRIEKGVLLPNENPITFTGSDGTHTLSLGAKQITLKYGSSLEVSSDKDSEKAKKKGLGFDDVKIKFEDGSQYALIFPFMDKSKNKSYIYYRPSFVAKGRAGTTELALYDDNIDGQFTTDDTIGIEKSFVYAPIKEYVGTPSKLYKIVSIDPAGETMQVAEVGGPVGRIDVDWDGPKADTQIAFASDNASFMCLGKGKTSQVPAGSYALQYGLVYSKKLKKPIAGVVPGNFAPIEVKEGAVSKTEMGEPFRVEFVVQKQGNKISISPSTIRLFGDKGEEYVAFEIQGTPRVALVDGKKEYPMGGFGFG